MQQKRKPIFFYVLSLLLTFQQPVWATETMDVTPNESSQPAANTASVVGDPAINAKALSEQAAPPTESIVKIQDVAGKLQPVKGLLSSALSSAEATLTSNAAACSTSSGANVVACEIETEMSSTCVPAISKAQSAAACIEGFVGSTVDFTSSYSICETSQKAAGNLCISSLSPEIQSGLMVLIPLIKSISSSNVAENCKKTEDIAGLAQKALLAYTVACEGSKAICNSACGKAMGSVGKVTSENKSCLSSSSSAIAAAIGACSKSPAALSSLNNAQQILRPSIGQINQIVAAENVVVKPGSTASKVDVCGRVYTQNLMAAGVGILQMIAQQKQANKCSNQSSSTTGPDKCISISDAAQKAACLETECAKAQYSSSLACQSYTCSKADNKFTDSCLSMTCSNDANRFNDKCLKITCKLEAYTKSSGCAKCANDPILCGNSINAKSSLSSDSSKESALAVSGGISSGGGSSSGNGSPEITTKTSGIDASDMKANANNSGAALAGGGGGAGMPSGSGVGGGSAADDGMAKKIGRFAASVFGESGGGGGFGGYRGSGDSNNLRGYLPGGTKDPSKVGGQSAWSKEITGAGGKSVWEKVKDRYNENRSTLIQDK